MIYFGPNERMIGRQFQGDPTVDEATQQLREFSVLGWLERYWKLSWESNCANLPGSISHSAEACLRQVLHAGYWSNWLQCGGCCNAPRLAWLVMGWTLAHVA